uniref:Putative secreted protein n=1 Tax=Amblyomma cajennense TaxID=34607 RepID=A0A023FD97_AMBCJ
MNLIGITLVACILLALACPLSACEKCPGSCTYQSCYNIKGQGNGKQKTRYFPNKQKKYVNHIHRNETALAHFMKRNRSARNVVNTLCKHSY